MDIEFIKSKEKQLFQNNFTDCPVCGKRFYVPTGMKKLHTYRKKNKQGIVRYSCSPSCFKKMQETF
jgi:hypothetical protein